MLKNAIGGKHLIDEDNWTLSVVRQKDDNHVFLVGEGFKIKENEHFIFKAHLCKQTKNPSKAIIISREIDMPVLGH